MSISDRVDQVANRLQDGAKSVTTSIFGFLLKFATGVMIGLTFTLIAQELMGFGTFSFVLLMLVIAGAITKLLSSWKLGTVLIFDLICILVALLVRMYILIAP